MTKPRKHLFDLSLQEQAEILNPVIKKIQQQNWDAGLYNIYQHPTDQKLLIRDYRDKREIVRVDITTGNIEIFETIIK